MAVMTVVLRIKVLPPAEWTWSVCWRLCSSVRQLLIYITGWAVAQTCCISQCAKYRKSGIFGYPWEQNPWTDRHETWCIRNYVQDPTPASKYGRDRAAWDVSTSCLVLGWGFRRRRIQRRHFRLDQIQDGGRRPSWKTSNGHMSATYYPIYCMYVHRPYFAVGL